MRMIWKYLRQRSYEIQSFANDAYIDKICFFFSPDYQDTNVPVLSLFCSCCCLMLKNSLAMPVRTTKYGTYISISMDITIVTLISVYR